MTATKDRRAIASASTRRASSLLRWAVLVSLLLSSTALAGAWVPEPGSGYAKVWLHWLPGLAYHAGDDAPRPGVHLVGAYQELGLGTWTELGVAPGFAITAHWMPVRGFFVEDARNGDVSSHAAVGEPEVGARLGLLRRGRFSSSVELALRAPVGDGRVVADVYSTEEGNPLVGGLRTSAGVWDGRIALSAGVGLPRVSVEGSVALVLRSDGFHPLVTWFLQGSTSLGKKGVWTGRLRLAAQHALPLGDAPWAESPSGIGNGAQFFGLTVELERRLSERWAVGASLAASMGIAARQAHGPAITLFVAHRF